jgi:N6-adenosine-specific RNA methylase IME4
MSDKKYQVIYADPPWSFNSKKTGGSMTSGAAAQYDTMTIADLKAMPVYDMLADDAILIMWYVSSQPQEALDLAKAWGFTIKNMNGFVWDKLTVKGKPVFGMGFYTRAGSESALIAVKGKAGSLIADHGVRAVRKAKISAHSKKPDEFRDDIVKMCGDVARLEMFARTSTEGWDVFGNEVENSIEIGVQNDS